MRAAALVHAGAATLRVLTNKLTERARRRWNFSPSPGWTKTEVAVLRLCLMVHGVGRWKEIECTGLLPGKLYQQLNGQTQRLLGQQSLAGDHMCKHDCHAMQLRAHPWPHCLLRWVAAC